MKKINSKIFNYGFTLIELLVVIVILSIILSITLIAVNPIEHIQKTKDISTKNVAIDFVVANIGYYASHQELPWNKNQNCMDELSAGGTLADMPSCVNELTGGGKLEENYQASEDLKKIHVTKCGNSAVLCYKPSSKVEIPNATYTKFGVNDPGCPGNGSDPDGCYWCKPVMNEPACAITPTPTNTPSPTPTVIPSPTNTPTPSLSPTPTSNPCPPPTNIPIPSPLPQTYALDDSKFLASYIVLLFPYPDVSPSWMIDISFRPDFCGTIAEHKYNPLLYYVPANADTILNVAYAGSGSFGGGMYAPFRKITSKYVGFISQPYLWETYKQGCGKTVYWRLYTSFDRTKMSPTYANIIDCNTKVGLVAPPISWYTVFNMQTYQQKYYEPKWDFDNSGIIDFTDYVIGALNTKFRSGGWAPPE